jgi:2-polyprenyl-6-methoxyphenol hydroxylase-like FAD-dependent oxidoreductase
MNEYDAIVVGARCAGAPTAMLLARRGYRVLLVDRATFPSDTQSTHLVHAPGVAALRRWGVLDAIVASGCPPIERYSFDFGPITIAGTQRPSGGASTAYAPRRTVLDAALVEAAAQAGVEVREGFTVSTVVGEGGRIVGIKGQGSGPMVSERARVVIGADGRSSKVAHAVAPPEYEAKPILQWSAYTYWSDLPADGMETIIRPNRGWAAIPTNDDLTRVVVGWPAAESHAYRTDIEGNYLATLDMAPEFAERVRSATRAERFRFGGVPNFYRRPFGPGWALVGDAGYCKDPITAQGISDAFVDAELCAGALDQTFRGELSFEEAMAGYQQARDTRTFPTYAFTTELATLAPPPDEVLQVLGAAYGNQDAMDDFVSVIAGTLSPLDFFGPAANAAA